jgi:cobalamin biosynthesis protein CobT
MVDQSGSMWRNEKRDRAFEAAVVVTEVLSRLGIEHSILGYTETQRTYKEFAEELDVEKLERMPLEGGTDNYDGAAVDYACGLLQQQEEDRKILIVISDGAPNDNLKAVTDRVQASGAVRLIGLGIGPDTSCVTQYYKHSRADIPVQDLPQALSEAVREAIEDVT